MPLTFDSRRKLEPFLVFIVSMNWFGNVIFQNSIEFWCRVACNNHSITRINAHCVVDIYALNTFQLFWSTYWVLKTKIVSLSYHTLKWIKLHLFLLQCPAVCIHSVPAWYPCSILWYNYIVPFHFDILSHFAVVQGMILSPLFPSIHSNYILLLQSTWQALLFLEDLSHKSL